MPRLTYANVVATLALFIAVGGASAFAAGQLGKNTVGPKQLKKNAVTTVKIKNQAVTGAKIKVGTLGTVPSATNADHARTADTATAADTASSLGAVEPIHYIGLPGEPQFENGFTDSGMPAVGFYKDHECRVHFTGELEGLGPSAFTLPPGFRPAQVAWAAILTGGPQAAQMTISPDGKVQVSYSGGEGAFLGLDSASFRVAGC